MQARSGGRSVRWHCLGVAQGVRWSRPGAYTSPCPKPLSGLLPQGAALIARYVGGGGELDKAALDTLATFRPAYLCVLRPEQLGSVQLSVLW